MTVFFANWAKSTLRSYSKVVNEFRDFCIEADSEFPHFHQAVLADFLCEIAGKTGRPKSTLNIALAAISSLCDVTEHKSFSKASGDMMKLVTGLIKSGTSEPMRRSKVMPVQPFMSLFEKWKGNWALGVGTVTVKMCYFDGFCINVTSVGYRTECL